MAWTPLGPESAEVREAVPTPGRLFIATGQQGVLARSDETGEWEQRGLAGREVSELVRAGPPGRLLAGVRVRWDSPDTALVATDDGGATWYPNVQGIPYEGHRDADHVRSLLADTIDRQLVFGGGRAGLVRSTDAGATWTVLWDEILPRVLAYTPADGGVVLVAYRSHGLNALLARSADGGESWTFVGKWPPGRFGLPLAFAVDHADPSIIWMAGGGPVLRRSSNAGELWDSIRAFPDLFSVGLRAAGDEIIAVYTEIGGPASVHVSCDAGLTWSAFTAPSEVGQALSSANGADGSLLIGTKTAGVWRVEPIGG